MGTTPPVASTGVPARHWVGQPQLRRWRSCCVDPLRRPGLIASLPLRLSRARQLLHPPVRLPPPTFVFEDRSKASRRARTPTPQPDPPPQFQFNQSGTRIPIRKAESAKIASRSLRSPVIAPSGSTQTRYQGRSQVVVTSRPSVAQSAATTQSPPRRAHSSESASAARNPPTVRTRSPELPTPRPTSEPSVFGTL